MATRRLKRPRDPVQLAKLIGDIATGQQEDKTEDSKSAIAIARGRKGGVKGGKSRMERLTADERRELACKAAVSRWRKKAPADKTGASSKRSVK